MNDFISRQAAIDALGDIHPLDYNAQVIRARLKALPSVEPECVGCDHCTTLKMWKEIVDIFIRHS